jgi:K+-sensing histidine kinase KdpD
MQNRNRQEVFTKELEFLSKKVLDLNSKLIEKEKTKSLFLQLIEDQLEIPIDRLSKMLSGLKIVCSQSEDTLSMMDNELFELELKIKNLAIAAHIESGNIECQCSQINILEIFDEILEKIRFKLKKKNLKVSLDNEIQKNLFFDKKLLKIILYNLFSNAYIYSFNNTVIQIEFEIENNFLIICVVNKGNAPDVTYKKEIFTRFVESENAKNGGLGLGLSVVRGICERFNGSINFFVEKKSIRFKAILSLKTNKDIDFHHTAEF